MLGISAAEAERAGRRIGEVETAGDAVAVGPDVRGTIGITVAIFRPVPDRIEPELRREIARSEEHTSELQSLMRISYAVFCLKKKNNTTKIRNTQTTFSTK